MGDHDDTGADIRQFPLQPLDPGSRRPCEPGVFPGCPGWTYLLHWPDVEAATADTVAHLFPKGFCDGAPPPMHTRWRARSLSERAAADSRKCCAIRAASRSHRLSTVVAVAT
jgi:hypothetical protein